MTIQPTAYRAVLNGLTILVFRYGAWQIRRNGEKVRDHDPVMPFDENEQDAKLEGVMRAAEELGLPDDPKAILASLEWETVGTEDAATQK